MKERKLFWFTTDFSIIWTFAHLGKYLLLLMHDEFIYMDKYHVYVYVLETKLLHTLFAPSSATTWPTFRIGINNENV